MGRLYIPPETKGLWAKEAQTLTVFVGEEVTIGYEGPEAARGDVRFSASERGSGEYSREVYRAGPTKLEAKVETPRPMTLSFEVTDGNGKALAPPIVVRVAMRPNLRTVAPVGQMDNNACWAACLEWWLAAAPGRDKIDQIHLIGRASGLAFRNGTLDPRQLDRLVTRNKFGMATRHVRGEAELRSHFGRWPMMIGFRSPGGFSHLNVLHGEDAATGMIAAMEPQSPDPVPMAAQLDTIDDGNGPPLYVWLTDGVGHAKGDAWKYAGAHVSRPATYYTANPFSGIEFWIGFPEEYVARL